MAGTILKKCRKKLINFLIGYKADFDIDKKSITEAPDATFFVDAAQNRHTAC